MSIQIAIDGPAGAGKSAVSKGVAQALGFRHLNTGAMYRALGLAALENGVSPTDEAALSALMARTDIAVRFDGAAQRTYLNGRDVSERIGEQRIGELASVVSEIAQVRAWMVAPQRAIAVAESMVVDGRDVGTVILPDARFKFYLTADVEVRAHRRFLEMRARGKDVSFETVLGELYVRDRRDIGRSASPLRRAEDALLIDTTALDETGVIGRLLQIVREGTQ